MGYIKLTVSINKDKKTNQYELSVEEVNILSCGITKNKAIEEAIDLIEETTKDYFENLKENLSIYKMKRLYPYYLELKDCSRSKIKNMLVIA